MFTANAAVVALYLIGFASLHSLLASLWVKRWAKRTFGEAVMRWYRLIFTLVAAATLLPLIYLFYLFPGEVLYSVPSPWLWMMIALQAAAALAFAKTFLAMEPLRFLGVLPDDGEGELIVRGIYCRTRNPLFLFALIFLWLTPVMTDNLLPLYIIATVYFYLGSIHEERMLAEEFGEGYLDYKRQVPRLIPRLRCEYLETRVEAEGSEDEAGPGSRSRTR